MAARPALLIVDDEPQIRKYVANVLAPDGYHCIPFADGPAAIRYLTSPDAEPVGLVVSDIGMPGMDGLEFLRSLKQLEPDIPVLFLSGLYNLSTAVDAAQRGACDYLLKPAAPDEILRMVRKHVRGHEAAASEAAKSALARFLEERERAGAEAPPELGELFDALGFKRFETLQHSLRVAEYSRLIAERLGLDREALAELELGAHLHDIGKIAIPHNVLMKPGPLTPQERLIVQMHPAIGRELLVQVMGAGLGGEVQVGQAFSLSGTSGIEAEAEIVYHHHERYDGRGYPEGLKGDAIPIGARIFAIADTLDAITAARSYRAARPLAAAREEILEMSGTQFDPSVVECFAGVGDDMLEAVQTQYPG